MSWWRLRVRVRRLLGLAARPEDRATNPPRVELALGRTLPGAVVRLLPVVPVLVCAAALGATARVYAAAAVAGVLAGWRPRWPVAAGLVLVIGVVVLATGDVLVVDPADGAVDGVWRAGWLVLGTHLLLVAAALAGHVSWTGSVEARVVGRALAGAAPAQAMGQSLLLLVAWLRAGQPVTHEWLRLLAVLAVVGAAVLLPRAWWLRERRGV